MQIESLSMQYEGLNEAVNESKQASQVGMETRLQPSIHNALQDRDETINNLQSKISELTSTIAALQLKISDVNAEKEMLAQSVSKEYNMFQVTATRERALNVQIADLQRDVGTIRKCILFGLFTCCLPGRKSDQREVGASAII